MRGDAERTVNRRMIDTNALRGAIVAKGMTQQEVAKHLGITPKTFYSRMKKGVFGSDDMEKMIGLLSLENPAAIFFAEKVT